MERVRLGAGVPVGILGGGQLARMLAEAAARLGLTPVVLAEADTEPAAQVCPDRVLGRMSDEAAVRALLGRVQAVVFENEFLDLGPLRRACADQRPAPALLPALETIAELRDKERQKARLVELRIPTAPYLSREPGAPLETFLRDAHARFPGGFVLKWGRFGYDGKGVFPVPPGGGDREAALRFCEEAVRREVSLYAEERVAFRRELALVAARSVRGEFAAYSMVVSEQESGVCRRCYGPAGAAGVAPKQEREAAGYAARLAESAGLVGVFALEFFELGSGELWVNELAPRVHNSGHCTLDAAGTSQFENHWRAVLGLPLGDTRPAPAFAMLNVLGPAGVSRPARGTRLPQPPPEGHLHWYGKAEIRPGRKLGHVNAVGARPEDLPGLLAGLERCAGDWAAQFERK